MVDAAASACLLNDDEDDDIVFGDSDDHSPLDDVVSWYIWFISNGDESSEGKGHSYVVESSWLLLNSNDDNDTHLVDDR